MKQLSLFEDFADKRTELPLEELFEAYLGIMKHYKTYAMRKKMIFKYLSAWWWNYVSLKNGYMKFVFKK